MSTKDQKNREARRRDPVLQAKVEDVLSARAEAAAKALRLVREANAAMREMDAFDENPLFNRSKDALLRAETQLAGDFQFIGEGRTDVYIGNMAAGELGETILAMGDDFEKHLNRK